MSVFGQVDSFANKEPWVADALCAQIGGASDLWYPEKGGATGPAVTVCKMCPVRARHLGGSGECLDYAVEHGERFGIWGGVPERTRRRMKRDGRKAA